MFRVFDVDDGGRPLFTDSSDPCRLWLTWPKVPDDDWSLPLCFGIAAPETEPYLLPRWAGTGIPLRIRVLSASELPSRVALNWSIIALPLWP